LSPDFSTTLGKPNAMDPVRISVNISRKAVSHLLISVSLHLMMRFFICAGYVASDGSISSEC
jgi:hypothetical protein